jgi:hypothetical protein
MEVYVSSKLVTLLAAVSRGTAETTILDLFEAFDLPADESTLAKVVMISLL